jgi:hypothetical protein
MRWPQTTGGVFLNQEPGRFEQNTGWFPVEIASVLGGGGYTFTEVEIAPDGTTRDKQAGRRNQSTDPAYALFGDTFEVGDGALCRTGRGAGGRVWELIYAALAVTESGSGTGTADGTLGYVRLGPIVTGVECDPVRGLVTTISEFLVTAVIVGGRIRFNVSIEDADECSAPSGTTTAWQVGGVTTRPLVYSIDVGTFDNATYASLEGPWTLTYDTAGTWQTGTTGDRWGLTGDSGGWTLTGVTAGGDTVRYVVLNPAAVACSAVALPRDEADGSGVTDPATLTITPA